MTEQRRIRCAVWTRSFEWLCARWTDYGFTLLVLRCATLARGQVQLDSGSLIYAPEDNDRYIKSLSAPADVDQILARERAGWVEQEDMPPDDSSEPSMSWEDIKNWDKPPNYPPPRPANWVPPDDEEPYRKRDWAQEPTAAEWGTGTEGSAHGKRFEIGGVEMVNAHHPDGTRGFVTAPEFARLEQLRVTTPSYDAEVRARIHWDGPREECRCYICLLEADCEQEEEEEGGMLCVGVSVRVHSLSSGPGHHLNGLVGVVVGYVQTSGRWRVKLPDGVKKNLKPANLTRCAATTAAASSSSAPAAAPARGRRGRGSGGKNPNGNTGRGGHGQQQQHVKQETGQELQPGRVKLVPPPDVSFSEMLAKPGAIEMLKGHIGISPDRDIPLQILQQMESDYNEQQRLAAAAGSDTASSADLDEISSESDDESDLPSRLSRGWQPASIVEMDPQAWMVQRGLDCFFYGFGNTYGSLRKAGLTDAEIICSVPDCTGKRALSERNVEWCAKANGRKTSLRYMTLAPEKAKQAAMAAGAKGWCALNLNLTSLSASCRSGASRTMFSAGQARAALIRAAPLSHARVVDAIVRASWSACATAHGVTYRARHVMFAGVPAHAEAL